MRSTGVSRSVSEIIRKAEKQIAGGKLASAKQLLEDAQKNDPNNEYINAILERVMVLGLREEDASMPASEAPKDTSTEPAVKVDPEGQPAEDVQSQVKQLTSIARDLYERGSVETAFESLMNAYMLDPLSRDVAQAETLIVPAFEMMKKRGTITVQQTGIAPTTAQILQQSIAGNGSEGQPSAPTSRLDQLKQQKEQERLVRERAMWRKASEAPKLAEAEDGTTASASDPQMVPPSPPKHKERLLSKLWAGKRLE